MYDFPLFCLELSPSVKKRNESEDEKKNRSIDDKQTKMIKLSNYFKCDKLKAEIKLLRPTEIQCASHSPKLSHVPINKVSVTSRLVRSQNNKYVFILLAEF